MAAIVRSCPLATRFHFNGFSVDSLNALQTLSETLVELTLSDSSGVGPTLANCNLSRLVTLRVLRCRDLTQEGLRQVACRSTCLEALYLEDSALNGSALAFSRHLPMEDFEPAAALQCFVCTERISDEVVRGLARACPRLQLLNLRDVGSAVAIWQTSMHCPDLRKLLLRGGADPPGWKDADIEALSKACPRLTTLHLEHGLTSPLSGNFLASFAAITDLSLAHLDSVLRADAMTKLAQCASHLTRLILTSCVFEDLGVVGALLCECRALRHLDLAYARGMNGEVAHSPPACIQLHDLDLKGSSVMDAQVVARVVRACVYLHSLDMRETAFDSLDVDGLLAATCDTEEVSSALDRFHAALSHSLHAELQVASLPPSIVDVDDPTCADDGEDPAPAKESSTHVP